MSESKMSYLRNFSIGNDYRAPGIFRGNAGNPGFAVAAMFRDRYPSQTERGQGNQPKWICGNYLQPSGPASTQGWIIELDSSAAGGAADLNFIFGNSAGIQDKLTSTIDEGVWAQRTILLHVFFGVTATLQKQNQAAMVFINGTLVAVVDAINGYTPPSSDNPFVIGVSPDVNFTPATTIGFAGMLYQDQVCDNPQSLSSYAECCRIAANVWEDVNATEDMRDGSEPLVSDMFSVRRGLPNVIDGGNLTWDATKGGEVLARSGTTQLAVEACKPRYYSGGVINFSFVQPPP